MVMVMVMAVLGRSNIDTKPDDNQTNYRGGMIWASGSEVTQISTEDVDEGVSPSGVMCSRQLYRGSGKRHIIHQMVTIFCTYICFIHVHVLSCN